MSLLYNWNIETSHKSSTPLCSQCYHRNRLSNDYSSKVAVKGTVSVLKAFSTALVKLQSNQTTSKEREVFLSHFSIYVRQGLLVSDKATQPFIHKGIKFIVESVKLGLEEILIVTTENERSGGKFLLS